MGRELRYLHPGCQESLLDSCSQECSFPSTSSLLLLWEKKIKTNPQTHRHREVGPCTLPQTDWTDVNHRWTLSATPCFRGARAWLVPPSPIQPRARRRAQPRLQHSPSQPLSRVKLGITTVHSDGATFGNPPLHPKVKRSSSWPRRLWMCRHRMRTQHCWLLSYLKL